MRGPYLIRLAALREYRGGNQRRTCMSVIMMLHIDFDPKKFEEFAADNPDRLKAISDQAVGHGLIAHRFLGNDESGKTMVVDEWEKAEDFLAFFEKVGQDVQALMADMDAGEPQG